MGSDEKITPEMVAEGYETAAASWRRAGARLDATGDQHGDAWAAWARAEEMSARALEIRAMGQERAEEEELAKLRVLAARQSSRGCGCASKSGGDGP